MHAVFKFITVLSLTSISFSTLSCKNKTSLRKASEETQEEKAESIKDAYTTTSDFSGTETEKKIAHRLLKLFGKALQTKNENAITQIFSSESLAEQCLQGMQKKLTSKEKKVITEQIIKTIPLAFTQYASLLDFDEIEILKIEKVSEKEFIAYTRGWDDTIETYTRTRWWFVKSEKKWQIYDSEDIEGGSRMSTLFVVMLSANTKGNTWFKPYSELTLALRNLESIDDLDFDQFTKNGKEIMESDAPELVKLTGSIVYLAGLTASEEFDIAKDFSAEMLIKHSDQHIFHYFLGASQYGLGNYDEALKSFQLYQDNMGEDSETLMLLSDSYYYKGDYVKAKDHSLRGITMNPRHAECLASYAVLLEKDEWPKILPMIKNTKKEIVAFEIIIDYAILSEKIELAKWLFTDFKTKFPGETDLIEYYEIEFEEETQETQ